MLKTIFVVDDNDANLSTTAEALEEQYRVVTLSSVARMFMLLAETTPDLILLELWNIEMDGLAVLRRLKADNAYAEIPVILLAGTVDASVEAQGFALGAVDCIIRPFSAPVLRNRIKTHLNFDKMIRERTSQLKHLQNGIVYVFADIIENRDGETGGHVERTAVYIKALTDAMVARGVYADEIYDWNLDLVISSARLHDVGKIVISDFILNKPGPLTENEFEIMKTHTLEGERIIEQIVTCTGEADFLHNAKLFAGCHHENWDGTGYPRGLKGTAIPLQGRIMALVDVFDALISDRPYKRALEPAVAVDIIMAETGKRFDPKIADVFFAVQEQFVKLPSLVQCKTGNSRML